MSLNFPNLSRSFEPEQNRIRFWGYDRAMEVTFFMKVETLMAVCPGVGKEEADLLEAFDTKIERIRRAASKVYARRRDLSYVHFLVEQDF